MESTVEKIEECKIALKELKYVKEFASGGYSVISKASLKGRPVVLRQVKPEARFKARTKKRFLEGVKIRRECGKHDHIVHYLGHANPLLGLPYEIIEYVDGKNLREAMVRKDYMLNKYRAFILQQCMMGLMQVHQSGYLHLDIKPENFIMYVENDRPMIKLTDFDLSLPINLRKAPDKFGGSLNYMAPEFLERKEISPSTDIFALGVLAYQMYTGRMPFTDTVQELIDNNYRFSYPYELENVLTQEIKEFIETCMARRSQDRYQDSGQMYVALENIKRQEMRQAAR